MKFRVEGQYTLFFEVEVEAEDEDAAEEKIDDFSAEQLEMHSLTGPQIDINNVVLVTEVPKP